MKNNLINTKYIIPVLCTMFGLAGCKDAATDTDQKEIKIDTCLVTGYDDATTHRARLINNNGIVYKTRDFDSYLQRGDTVLYDTKNEKIVKNLTMERMEQNYIKSR